MIFGFLVVVAATLAAFVWVADVANQNFGGGIRVYQIAPVAMQTAGPEVPAAGMDHDIETSSVASPDIVSR